MKEGSEGTASNCPGKCMIIATVKLRFVMECWEASKTEDPQKCSGMFPSEWSSSCMASLSLCGTEHQSLNCSCALDGVNQELRQNHHCVHLSHFSLHFWTFSVEIKTTFRKVLKQFCIYDSHMHYKIVHIQT